MLATFQITLIQGTDETKNFAAANADGSPINLCLAKVTQTVRNADGDAVLTKTSINPTQIKITDGDRGRYSIFYRPIDTLELPLGSYKHEVRAVLKSGDVVALIPVTFFEITLGGVTANTPPVLSNTVVLDHNFGYRDSFSYLTPGGSPIEDAQIRVYYKADYDSKKFDSPLGTTSTRVDGRWKDPILVFPGFEYVIQFLKTNQFGPDTAVVTV